MITLYNMRMSKDLWVTLGALAGIIAFVLLFGTIDPFTRPTSAPTSDIPLGSFDGSGAFADSLTKAQLASPAAATGSTSTKASTTPDASGTTPPGLALALGDLRDSLVNIVCAARDGSVRSVSGSGVIISKDGLILTNSHIAQLFLLKNYPNKNNVVCVVRNGNPARTAYYADIAYISNSWMTRNPRTLVLQNPTGTGQDDFAVLAITASATDAALPTVFPYVPLTKDEPYDNQPVAIGSYGAQTLTATQIKNALYPSLVFAKVKERYTFEQTTVDVLSLGGSVVAQHGSSGGGAVNQKGELIALITTSTTEGALVDRDLHAITIGHIRRSFLADTGTTFDSFLTSNTPGGLVTAFKDQATTLATTLTKALSSK